MRKHLFSLTIMLLAVLSISAQGVTEEVAASNASHPTSIVASTSWTAAFADLGGLDDVAFIAPASLTHPPEYEITVSDVVKINHADYFIYAGYERMMQSMGDSIKKEAGTMIQITTTNDIENVKKQAATIASITGTEEKSKERLASYVATIKKGAKQAEELGLTEAKVYCHAMQVYLAEDLGLQVAGTFGPGPVTAQQISEVSKGGYQIIIDNIHNPIAGPLMEVSPDTKLVVWRNFPERGGRGSLESMVQANIDALLQ